MSGPDWTGTIGVGIAWQSRAPRPKAFDKRAMAPAISPDAGASPFGRRTNSSIFWKMSKIDQTQGNGTVHSGGITGRLRHLPGD
jgi:hypothetical protein